MKIISLLQPELIFPDVKIASKAEAIRFLLEHMGKVHKFEHPAQILQAVLDREALGGTSFETGIAIPHARIAGFNDLIIGICIPRNPFVDDSYQIRCVVVILTSAIVSNLYLKTLACLVKISGDKALWERLLASSAPARFLEVIKDIYVEKELNTKDIMEKEFCKVTPQTNLKELADLFYKTNETYAAVEDNTGKFIGEVRVADLIKMGIPNYAYMIGKLKFLSTLEPFEELLANEENITVQRIMIKPQLQLNPETPIIEAALELTQANRSQLPVVAGRKIVGLLKITGILNKIIRG